MPSKACRANKKPASIPTPFSRVATVNERSDDNSHVSDNLESKCFIPACSSNVSQLMKPYINVDVLAHKEPNSEGVEDLVKIRFVSCPLHGHVMKARKQKKSIHLHQHCRVRNLLDTVFIRTRNSLKNSLNEYFALQKRSVTAEN